MSSYAGKTRITMITFRAYRTVFTMVTTGADRTSLPF